MADAGDAGDAEDLPPEPSSILAHSILLNFSASLKFLYKPVVVVAADADDDEVKEGVEAVKGTTDAKDVPESSSSPEEDSSSTHVSYRLHVSYLLFSTDDIANATTWEPLTDEPLVINPGSSDDDDDVATSESSYEGHSSKLLENVDEDYVRNIVGTQEQHALNGTQPCTIAIKVTRTPADVDDPSSSGEFPSCTFTRQEGEELGGGEEEQEEEDLPPPPPADDAEKEGEGEENNHHEEEEEEEDEGDPAYGRSEFACTELVTSKLPGTHRLVLRQQIAPYTTVKGGLQVGQSFDWYSRPGRYGQCRSTLQIEIASAQPIVKKDEVPRPYEHVAFIMQYDDTELLLALEQLVRSRNATTMGFEGTESYILQLLNTYKTGEEEERNDQLDILTGFHLQVAVGGSTARTNHGQGGTRRLWSQAQETAAPGARPGDSAWSQAHSGRLWSQEKGGTGLPGTPPGRSRKAHGVIRSS